LVKTTTTQKERKAQDPEGKKEPRRKKEEAFSTEVVEENPLEGKYNFKPAR